MDIRSSVSSPKTSETELLSFLTEYATANDLPFAVWKLPDSPTRQLLISHQYEKVGRDLILEDQAPGFIFAPFDRTSSSIFLPANFLFSFENGNLKESINPIESSSAEWLEREFKKQSSKPKSRYHRQKLTLAQPDDTHFLQLIDLCLAEVEKGSFEKIVPSRIKHVNLPADFDIITAFQKLCGQYPNALISFVSIPGIGSWLGATPEVLVSVEDRNIFKTVALAGTQPYKEGMNLKSVSWKQKEIEEQALVERYIISCFKKIRLREYDEHGPKTVVAGNLIHLKSDFTVNMRETNFLQLGTVMLQLLHPTSAVCGMPLDASTAFLKKHEGYDRSFYSGFLGPVNVNDNIHIFVNLRCMQLLDHSGILYAGAGITIDSVPEEEFEETEMKFNTLRNVIFS